MPADHDTVIMDLKAEVRSFCGARDWDQFHGPKDLADAVRAKLAENEERYPAGTARDSNRKAP